MKNIITALSISMFAIFMTACDSNSSSSDAEQMTENSQDSTQSVETMGSKVDAGSEEVQNAWADFGSSSDEEEESGSQ